jgi:hypothetical protein
VYGGVASRDVGDEYDSPFESDSIPPVGLESFALNLLVVWPAGPELLLEVTLLFVLRFVHQVLLMIAVAWKLIPMDLAGMRFEDRTTGFGAGFGVGFRDLTTTA